MVQRVKAEEPNEYTRHKRIGKEREFAPSKNIIYLECWTGSKYFHNITKTWLYSFDPLKPHLYIVKLGFTGVYIIFLISAQKHRW